MPKDSFGNEIRKNDAILYGYNFFRVQVGIVKKVTPSGYPVMSYVTKSAWINNGQPYVRETRVGRPGHAVVINTAKDLIPFRDKIRIVEEMSGLRANKSIEQDVKNKESQEREESFEEVR